MSADQLLHASRAEQRRLRLLEAERELAAEEAEALTITEEQRQTLLRPFAAVKAEFSDLDGLRWTQTALRRRQSSHRIPPPPDYPIRDPNAASATTNAFVVLTNADLASFAPDDTIRIPPQPTRSRPRFPSPLIRGTTSLPSTLTSDQHHHQDQHIQRPPTGHRDGTRQRSPVKALFYNADGIIRHDLEDDYEFISVQSTPRAQEMEMERHGDGYGPPGLGQGQGQAPKLKSRETISRWASSITPPELPTSSLLDAPPQRSPMLYYSSSSFPEPPSSLSSSKHTLHSHPHSHLHRHPSSSSSSSSSQSTSTSQHLISRVASTSTLSIRTTSPPNYPSTNYTSSNHTPPNYPSQNPNYSSSNPNQHQPTTHLPRRHSSHSHSKSSSKSGSDGPRPTRSAPSPPTSIHLAGGQIGPSDVDGDADTESSSLLDRPPPPVSYLLSHKKRPLARTASFSVLSSSSMSNSYSNSSYHPGSNYQPDASPHSPHSQLNPDKSPRARLASLLEHPPIPGPSSSTGPPPAHHHYQRRARSSSSSSSPVSVSTTSATPSTNAHPPSGSSPTLKPPPGLKGWHPENASVNGAGGGGYESDDDKWDEEETPRASPVESPVEGHERGQGGRSPSRAWIRGFA